MNYINKNSNRGIVNLLADFIIKEINKESNHDSVIEVTDCGKFFVVNGMTSTSVVLNMSEINDKFLTEYKSLMLDYGYEHINIIDLIIYDTELVRKDEFWFTFYRSERPIYKSSLISLLPTLQDVKYNSINNLEPVSVELDFSQNDTSKVPYFTYSPLNISSEFPHGYSLSMGRLMLYYSEYISNQLFTVLHTDKIDLKISTILDNNEDFSIEVIGNSAYPNKTIKSMILDVFDFNLNKFEKTLSDYDLIMDIEDPTGNKPWLITDRLSDLVMF